MVVSLIVMKDLSKVKQTNILPEKMDKKWTQKYWIP